MCRLLLPNDQIHRIKYFTALVSARPNDPDQPVRQQLFLRALQTIPNLEIILGTFLSHEVKMPLSPIGSGYAKVMKTEEKGSDVNIATHLLVDGFRNDYELAVVVSNDSDLLLPIQKACRLAQPTKAHERGVIAACSICKEDSRNGSQKQSVPRCVER